MVILIIQAIVFFGYLFAIQRKFGWTRSISISYYKLGSVSDNIIFIGWTVTIGFLTALFGYLSGESVYWFFASGFCISFVGVTAPYAVNKYVKALHYLFATGCILSPAIGMAFIGNLLPIVGITIAALAVSLSEMNHKFYWIEVTAYTLILSGMVRICVG